MTQNNEGTEDVRNTQSNPSTPSHPNSQNQTNSQGPQKITFLPKHGHYSNLRVYKVAEIIYDITFYFTEHYLRRGDRTIDQMVQAARSGKQNIAEGNQAAPTSSETEIRLTNVAKASLEELLKDYEDYIRVRKLQQWDEHHPRFAKMRQYARSERIMKEYTELIEKLNDEEIANLSITLIHQAIYMLYKLLETMQNRFVTEGGIKELMHQSRVSYRNGQHQQISQDSTITQNTGMNPPQL